MAYEAKWVTIENGVTALFIRDVVMASYVHESERGWTLDDGWWKHAADTAATREAKGKFAGLIFKRNTFTHTDPLTAGRFSNLRWNRPYAVANWIVTDPEEIGAILRGERTQLSIEAQVENFLVWGVELIQGSEGHFSEDIPELRVSGVSVRDPEYRELQSARATAARLRAPDPELVALAARPLKGQTMPPEGNQPPQGGNPPAGNEPQGPFTPEQQAAIKQVVLQVIRELQAGQQQMSRTEIEKLVSDKLAGKPAAAKPTGDAAKLAKDLEAEQLRNTELETRLATLERTQEIDGYVAKLRKQNHPLDDDKLREQLGKLSTREGREECFKRLESFKLNRDEPPADPATQRRTALAADNQAQHDVLKLEWEKRKDLWKANGYETAEEYANFQMTGDRTLKPEGVK